MCSVASPCGALSFELSPATPGIHVMRIHLRDDIRIHCSVLFEDAGLFADWLDADPLRFTHPLVFQQARRCFDQLLAGEGATP